MAASKPTESQVQKDLYQKECDFKCRVEDLADSLEAQQKLAVRFDLLPNRGDDENFETAIITIRHIIRKDV